MKKAPESSPSVSHPTSVPLGDISKAIGALTGLVVLVALAFLGGAARRAFHLPLPDLVVGMVLLAGGALLMERLHISTSRRIMKHLAPVGRLLLSHMGLFFVPAGVGIVTTANAMHGEWIPIVAALAGSTLLSLAVTGLGMHYFLRREGRASS
jgi:holin-like protein